jgi:hypothetical protein
MNKFHALWQFFGKKQAVVIVGSLAVYFIVKLFLDDKLAAGSVSMLAALLAVFRNFSEEERWPDATSISFIIFSCVTMIIAALTTREYPDFYGQFNFDAQYTFFSPILVLLSFFMLLRFSKEARWNGTTGVMIWLSSLLEATIIFVIIFCF